MSQTLPLDGLLVVDFSQFLAGPSAALRLADLGANVIKIERPEAGDLCRQLYVSDLQIDGDSTLFHTINRNKKSFSADLKNAEDVADVWRLIKKADVVIQNFRPGIIEKLGFDYDSVRRVKPDIVYGSITGYGRVGPWATKPGQDLLVQALSGLTWLNGNSDQGPVPVGVAVADILTGAHLVQGILAKLVQRGVSNQGGHVEVSLLESTLDFQFEFFSTYLNDRKKAPNRSEKGSASAYLSAPYGVYATQDGYLAIAMNAIEKLGTALNCSALQPYFDPATWFIHRDEIKKELEMYLVERPTKDWLSILEPLDVWCAEVLSWEQLLEHEGFKALDMIQTVSNSSGCELTTTRCPITVDGRRLKSSVGAPKIGEHTQLIKSNYLI